MRPPLHLATGLVLLLTMLGLPVAPVLCDLACPSGSRQGVPVVPVARVTATHSAAPCHDSGTARGDGDKVVLDATSRPASVRHASLPPMHGCDHPTVVSVVGSDGVRVPAPLAVAWHPTRHLTARHAPHGRVVQTLASQSPAPAAAGAFSLILRI